MSELINTHNAHTDFRWQLLATASVLAICGTVYTGDAAKAGDADRPTVWIELGGQLERVQTQEEPFAAPFTIANLNAPYNAISPLAAQRAARYAIGGETNLSLQPAGSDWVFGLGVRYGRSNAGRHRHQQTSTKVHRYFGVPGTAKYSTFDQTVTRFDDTVSASHETHAILDFNAGKDVGLGLFGGGTHSVFSLGIRYAQFHANSTAVLRSFPDPYYPAKAKYTAGQHHHSYYAKNAIARSFHGIGPSISLSGSSRFLGNSDTTEVAFDWGANAALLFGRQKVRGEHLTTARYFHGGGPSGFGFLPVSTFRTSASVNRSRSVIVPNVGGFAGLSLHRENAKVSLGYRADFFFGAMDGGIDARRNETVGFHGPFATVSIGLGG